MPDGVNWHKFGTDANGGRGFPPKNKEVRRARFDDDRQVTIPTGIVGIVTQSGFSKVAH